MGGVRVVDVPVRVVRTHQRVVEEVAAQDLAEGVRDPFAVAQPGGDEGVVQVSVRRVVLGAPEFEGPVGGLGEVGGVVGGDLVEGPDPVEVAEVAVVVGVVEAGPGPFGEGAFGVGAVGWEPVGEGVPGLRALGVVGGGRAQGVPGGGEVHGRVDRAPAGVGGAVLG